MRTDLHIDVQGRALTAGPRTSAAAVVGPWYRGDTVALGLFPLARTGNQWSPFVIFSGALYAVTVRLVSNNVTLATSSAWPWGSDYPDAPVENYDRWDGKLLLAGAEVEAALAPTGEAACLLEIELAKAGEFFTVAQHAVTLKRDYITH